MKDFWKAIIDRRSIYSINNQISVTQQSILEIVENAILHTPYAFNSQSSRAVVLFGEQHLKLWNIARETLRKIIPADAFPATDSKISSFAAGAGTVLLFEDMSVVEGLQRQFPLYADNFPVWSWESQGMCTLVVWTALEQEGLGASLQHYNPLIDDEVKSTWNLPASWKLLGQMPFGNPIAPAGEKQFLPVNDRVKVFK